jgi:hypothetical protein
MPLSVRAAFLAAIAGAVTISAQGTARAQDVPALCAMVTNDDRVRLIPITLIFQWRASFSASRLTHPTNTFKKHLLPLHGG